MNSKEIVKITIEDIPPSNNRFLGKKGMNWEYSKFKKMWAKRIKNALDNTYPDISEDKPFSKATVHIHYIFPDKRRRDPDNYSGKMLLDPLVTYGVIEDDTFNNVTLKISAETEPKTRRTIIEVEKDEKSGKR